MRRDQPAIVLGSTGGDHQRHNVAVTTVGCEGAQVGGHFLAVTTLGIEEDQQHAPVPQLPAHHPVAQCLSAIPDPQCGAADLAHPKKLLVQLLLRNLKQNEEAIKAFQTLTEKYPDSPRWQKAKFRIGELNYVLQKYPAKSLKEDEEFCGAVAEIQGEFLVIHPFREGNARTIKLMTDLLATQTGRPLLALFVTVHLHVPEGHCLFA